jgi:hypothetical protein
VTSYKTILLWTNLLPWRYYFPIMASERIQKQIDRLLDEAAEAFAQGDWRRLEGHARRVLLLDAENRDAISFLAAAERALGDAGHLEPILKSNP